MTAEKLKARGTSVMLEHGGLPEVLPPYLIELIESTGGPDGPIGIQFVARPDLETAGYEDASDPLLEEEHEVAPGLIYKYEGGEDEYGKYPGRVLFTVTRNCAAYCRYCTRGREVGIPANLEGPLSGALSHTPHLSKEQIDQSLDYIRQVPEITEVILSGGDPLTIRPDVLKYVLGNLGEMQRSGKLGVVRIGTRVPIHNPRMLKDHHFEALGLLKNPRLMVHINHKWELTDESLAALNRFRSQSGAIVMSQSVLLRGVNDHPQVLRELFTKVADEGFIPYYIYQNDEVSWAKHFTVPLEEAFQIWQHVRNRLSGVAATARFVIDTPDGYGKIPLPEGGAWNVDIKQGYDDFRGKHHHVK
jgi:lysine 2,3-aminomutase